MSWSGVAPSCSPKRSSAVSRGKSSSSVQSKATRSLRSRPGKREQVVRSPQKPRDEAGDDAVSGKLRDGLASAECRHHAERLILEGPRRFVTQHCHEIVGENAGLRESRAGPSSDKRRLADRESRRSRRVPRRLSTPGTRISGPVSTAPRLVNGSASLGDGRRRRDAGTPDDRLALDAPSALQRQSVVRRRAATPSPRITSMPRRSSTRRE